MSRYSTRSTHWTAAALLCLALSAAACTSAQPDVARAAEVGATTDAVDPGVGRDDAPSAPRIARGKYLVAIGGCHDCHTPGFQTPGMTVPDSALLVGTPMGFSGPWGTSYASNLRLKLRELPEREWVSMVRKRDGLPPMPWPSLRAMTDADLSAVYSYVRSLGPAGVPAPAALPPGARPTTPYIVFEPVFPGGAPAR